MPPPRARGRLPSVCHPPSAAFRARKATLIEQRTLRPHRVRCSPCVAVSCPALLDLRRRQPRLRQGLLREQHHQPTSIEPVSLRALARPAERLSPRRDRQGRHRSQARSARAKPTATQLSPRQRPRRPTGQRHSPMPQLLAAGLETRLGDLTALALPTRRLKSPLVNIARCVYNVSPRPPFRDRSPGCDRIATPRRPPS